MTHAIDRRTLIAGTAAALVASSASGTTPPVAPIPRPRPILFHDVTVINPDGQRDDVGLAVRGDVVEAIGPTSEMMARYPDADRYDGRGKALLPGLVNCHAHLAAVLERGFNEDFGFPNAADLKVRPASLLSPEERVLMVRIGALEAIRSGTTTLTENVAGIAPAAAALADSGLRMVLAEAIRDSENVPGPLAPEGLRTGATPRYSARLREEGLARIAALHARWHGHDNGRVSVFPAAALAETSSPELLRAVRDFADRHGLGYTIHLSQSQAEVDYVRKHHGVSPVGWLDRAGFLGPRLFAAHCRYVDAGDIARLGATRTIVSHQAVMAGNRGNIPPIPALRAAGCPIAYGSDNNINDMFEVMRTALLTERVRRNDPFPGIRPQPEDALEDCVAGGALATGGAATRGRLAAGRKADLIVVNLRQAHLVPHGRPLSAWIHNGQPSDVESSMVDGRFLMRDRKVLTMDEAALVAKAERVGRRVWDRVRAAGPIPIPGRG